MMRRRRRKRRPGWGSCGDERVVGLGFGGVITEREDVTCDGWMDWTDWLHLSRDGKENVTTLKRFSPCAMVRLPLPLPPAFFLFSFKGYQVRLQCMASLPVLCKSLSWTEISSDFWTGIPLVMSVVLFFPKGNCINVLRMVFFEETTRWRCIG
jgi:hypothetical protein